MASYSVSIKRTAAREIEALPDVDRQRVIRRIQGLSDDPRPRGCEKLSGQERYRLRQGRYRIVYSIEDCELVVWVVRVSHRRDAYR